MIFFVFWQVFYCLSFSLPIIYEAENGSPATVREGHLSSVCANTVQKVQITNLI